MDGVTVVAGDASAGLAESLATGLGAPLIRAGLRTFPDGEGKITFGATPESGRAVVVQSLCPPVDSNLVQALLMIAKAREFSSDVTAVIPYMGYARQDREFLPGEAVAIQTIARLFRAVDASRLIVVDIHSKTALDHFGAGARNVTAIPELARHFEGMSLKDPLVVSPDAGGAARAEGFAGLCGHDFIALEKKRDKNTGSVSVSVPVPDIIQDRDVILVDDMISTGGSIAKAAELLRGRGCRRIFAACTHALLVGDARQRIMDAGVSEIVGTNTVPGPAGVVDVSGAIIKGMAHC